MKLNIIRQTELNLIIDFIMRVIMALKFLIFDIMNCLEFEQLITAKKRGIKCN